VNNIKQSKLRYSEIFYSIQGEGKFVGVPSVFLRTFGCNFRCPKFGLARGTPREKYNPEVKKLIDDGVHLSAKSLLDLPLVHTGCDTYASIYPEFKRLAHDKTVDEVVAHLLSTTPNGKWVQDNNQDVHLILTGGEPLLGWQRLYVELFDHPDMQDLRNVTIETNSTQMLTPEFKNYLNQQDRFHVTFSCSPKLSVSGEAWASAIKPAVVADYTTVNNSSLYLKFVVAEEIDVAEVDQAVGEYQAQNINVPVYLMPLGGRNEGYILTVTQVSKLAMSKGYRFTPRLHITLFGNEWGT